MEYITWGHDCLGLICVFLPWPPVAPATPCCVSWLKAGRCLVRPIAMVMWSVHSAGFGLSCVVCSTSLGCIGKYIIPHTPAFVKRLVSHGILIINFTIIVDLRPLSHDISDEHLKVWSWKQTKNLANWKLLFERGGHASSGYTGTWGFMTCLQTWAAWYMPSSHCTVQDMGGSIMNKQKHYYLPNLLIFHLKPTKVKFVFKYILFIAQAF